MFHLCQRIGRESGQINKLFIYVRTEVIETQKKKVWGKSLLYTIYTIHTKLKHLPAHFFLSFQCYCSWDYLTLSNVFPVMSPCLQADIRPKDILKKIRLKQNANASCLVLIINIKEFGEEYTTKCARDWYMRLEVCRRWLVMICKEMRQWEEMSKLGYWAHKISVKVNGASQE